MKQVSKAVRSPSRRSPASTSASPSESESSPSFSERLLSSRSRARQPPRTNVVMFALGSLSRRWNPTNSIQTRPHVRLR